MLKNKVQYSTYEVSEVFGFFKSPKNDIIIVFAKNGF